MPRPGMKCTVKTAYTSPTQIKLHERRALALDYRRQRMPFKTIAQQLSISVGTAYSDVSRAIKELLPQETVEQVVAMELALYDDLTTVHREAALKGDLAAGEFCMKISNQRLRLVGAYPEAGTVNVNNVSVNNAETKGIVVAFSKPPADFVARNEWTPDTPQKLIEGKIDRAAKHLQPEYRMAESGISAANGANGNGGGEIVRNGAVIRDRKGFKRQW